MEALLPTTLAVLLGETGGRLQAEGEALSRHYKASFGILAAALLVSLSVLLAAGIAGIWVADQLTYAARTMLLGIALLFTAGGLIWKSKQPKPLVGGQAFPRSVMRFFLAMLSSNAPFLVFAFAGRGNAPLIATIAGVVGVIVAIVPPLVAPEEWRAGLFIQQAKKLLTIIFGIAGLYCILSALRIV